MSIDRATGTDVISRIGNFIQRHRAETAIVVGSFSVLGSGCATSESGASSKVPGEGKICIIDVNRGDEDLLDDADLYFDGESDIKAAAARMSKAIEADQETRTDDDMPPVGRYALCKAPGLEQEIVVYLPEAVESTESQATVVTDASDPRYEEFFTEINQ